MSVVVIGLNHRTAPLDLLERTAVDDARLPKVLHDLCARTNLSEAVVLSTCNRTEVYAIAEKFHGGYDDVRNFFVDLSFLPSADFADHLYVHYDDAAVTHLFRVAAGLDSAVLGESEILGQVGTAWDLAREEGTTGSALNLLFRHALEVGKRVRTETGIGRGITSVAQAAVAMASDRLGSLDGRRVLLLGAGEMAEGMATTLAAAGAADVVVANRTWETAKTLANNVGGRAVRLADLAAELVTADVLLTSTGARTIMLEFADLASAMGHRSGRPLLIVDIAMPRDVDPSAGDIDGVTLLDMDDLRRFVDVGVQGRQQEATRAGDIVEDELARYRSTTSAREAAPLVTALRERAEEVRTGELDRLKARLADLDDRERDAVEALTKGIVAKLLHEPTVKLKDAAGTAKGDRLNDALRDLFDL
ncbi:MAG TPA: glutamyl-tRNA reductase [Acidimicrobiales bacterium]|nr:glutamyl-tRNA reductase [Acidimicrobiales bacterium]